MLLSRSIRACRKLSCGGHKLIMARLLLLFCALAAGAAVFAQTATADLSGAVYDSNGAVVPNALVTLSNQANNFRRETRTNSEGFFSFSQAPPGVYKIESSAQGFSAPAIEGIVLNVGDRRSLTVVLRVGQVSSTVTVESKASLTDESPSLGTVVDRQFVENLPLNGRSFQSLIRLAPGVALTKANFLEPGQFSVNGQRANANYFTVDGVSANVGVSTSTTLSQYGSGSQPGFNIFGGTNSLVSVDALQEFKIQTSTFAPEFGRTPGAQVQIATRSGANRFSGSLFEYFRNDALDANDFFANRNGLKRPPLRQNDFGGTLGGPLFLPRFGEGGPALYHGRDRTFFFASYEGLRLRQPQVGVTEVPTVAARQSANGLPRQLLDLFPYAQRPRDASGFGSAKIARRKER